MKPFAVFPRSRPGLPDLTPARRRLVIAGLAASAVLFVCGLALTVYLWRISRKFPEAPYAQPSRLYASVPALAPGEPFSAAEMVAELADAGYREESGEAAGAELPAGAYRRAGDLVAVHLRRFPTPEGEAGGGRLEVAFRGPRVAAIRLDGKAANSAQLEPPLLASFYDKSVEERRPVTLAALPDPVVKAVLAAEDSGFYTHPGVSPTGIARALWVNARGGDVQGGSTISQQLVKNVYLSSRRTLKRKAEEALIAEMLELRHGKKAILEAYLNEIYLGRSGNANLIGLGAAARAYFGKDAAELSLPEAATVAGMIESPGSLSPIDHPEKSVDRRNRVLQRMGDLGWISKEAMAQAVATPLTTHPQAIESRPIAPYFARAAEAEARERFHAGELDGGGYLLFATLRWRDQRQAEAAVAQGIAALEGKKGHRHPLQSALVSVDPRDGAVLAWVGGRDYERSQFDRVTQAHRQVGSSFKPVVYGAALAEGTANPATLLQDSPINVRIGNASWQPQNYDRTFRGWVTARMALEQSLNIPTVRVAMGVGMPRVIDLAREMGMTGNLPAVPSAALGVFEATPYEMAEVYSTLAAGGLRPQLHSLAAVLKPGGEAETGDDLPAPKRAMPAETAYQVTSMLQGVIDHGTAAASRAQGVTGPLAGKTGTTSDRRDNWFAGYSPDRVSIVWVGYDNNAPTAFSGASAALPIWSRFTAAVRPAKGYADFPVPPGMVKVTIDPTTGQLATELCPYKVTEMFAEWQAPTETCLRHAPGGPPQQADITLGGQPLDPAAAEEPHYAITDNGLEVTQGDGEQAALAPVQPVPVPAAPAPAGLPVGATPGAILIRPARAAAAAAPEPAPAAPVAGADGRVTGKKATASVAGADGRVTGKKAAAPAEEPAEPTDGEAEEPPPP
jgi:penicillin-binding protein 1B